MPEQPSTQAQVSGCFSTAQGSIGPVFGPFSPSVWPLSYTVCCTALQTCLCSRVTELRFLATIKSLRPHGLNRSRFRRDISLFRAEACTAHSFLSEPRRVALALRTAASCPGRQLLCSVPGGRAADILRAPLRAQAKC